MLKTILFDLDDTLLDFHAAEAAALSETLRRVGQEPLPEVLARYSAINARQWQLLEEGAFTREEILVRRYALLFEELGLDASPVQANDYYEQRLAYYPFTIPGALELMRSLQGRFTLAAVSNGSSAVQHRRLHESGLDAFFSGVFISEEMAADKPSAAFFDLCFAALPPVDRQACLIVGDSLTSDILGGINAGVPTCWFNPHGKPARADIPADYEVRSLDELSALIDTLSR